MTKGRKTCDVGSVLFHANYFLKNSKPEQVGERKGTIAMINGILHASGNYCGFGYLTEDWKNDETRVRYYVGSAIADDYVQAELGRDATLQAG